MSRIDKHENATTWRVFSHNLTAPLDLQPSSQIETQFEAGPSSLREDLPAILHQAFGNRSLALPKGEYFEPPICWGLPLLSPKAQEVVVDVTSRTTTGNQ